MKNFLTKFNFPALKALVLIAGMLGIYQSYGQEFLLRDATFTWDENEERGYYYWREFCGAPQGNWTSPYNYKDGAFQFRIQILSKPTTNANRFNMCIWTEFNSSAVTWRESCYSISPYVTGTGAYKWP